MKDNKYPDEKTLQIAADLERGLILMRFPEPVSLINLQPSHARNLARNLLDLTSMTENKGATISWSIFKNPADHPGKYVGRKFIGTGACNQCVVKDTLDEVREAMPIGSLVRLEPMEGDVPSLVETWI